VAVVLDILALAGIYGLFAIGLTLVFGVLEVLNLAHAATFAFAAIFAMFLVAEWHLQLWVGCAVAILAGGAVGVLTDRLAFRTLRGRVTSAWGRHMGPLLTSLGVATIIQGLDFTWFGFDPRHFPNQLLPADYLLIGGQRITDVSLVIIVVFLLIVVALSLVLSRTRWGAEIRAVAERGETAALFGIDTERRFMETMALAGMMAGMAGVAWGLTFNLASPEISSQVDVKGFALIILGGMGSVPGSLLGALVIAGVEVLGSQWLPNGAQELVVFAVLFALLVARPQGLLGRRLVAGAR
jgi:branched-chain amino acid transport system permease protein